MTYKVFYKDVEMKDMLSSFFRTDDNVILPLPTAANRINEFYICELARAEVLNKDTEAFKHKIINVNKIKKIKRGF